MMNTQRCGWTALVGVALLLSAGTTAAAGPYDASAQPIAQQPFSVTTTVNENGNGFLTNTDGFFGNLASARQNDPGPGGLNNVLTFSLLNPPGLSAGDVLLQDGVGGPILDVVRFNPNQICVDGSLGCLVFYSDNVDGFDSPADTPSPPLALYANTAIATEIGPEGNNSALYTPVAGQPGFVAGAAGPVHYVLISDVAVPEPASLAILAVSLLGMGAAYRRFRK